VLHLAGFDDETSESVRDSVLSGGVANRLSNQINAPIASVVAGQNASGVLQRVTDLPIYRSDALVRRAPALQESGASRAPAARMHTQTLASLGCSAGDSVRIKSSTGAVTLVAVQDDTLPAGAVRIAAGFAQTALLGSAFGQLQVERA